MRKTEIANRIHQEAGIPQEKAARLLDSIVDLLKSTLQKGEPIIIPNFGKFTVRSKSTRLGRNPSTGEPIMIPAHRVVTFLSLIHISEPTRQAEISYAVFCLKK